MGANDTTIEGVWEWYDHTPVRMGTPLWAGYTDYYGNYIQYPDSSSDSASKDCACLDHTKYVFFLIALVLSKNIIVSVLIKGEVNAPVFVHVCEFSSDSIHQTETG